MEAQDVHPQSPPSGNTHKHDRPNHQANQFERDQWANPSLHPILPREEALQRGLEAALAISDEWSRARALAALVPQLAGGQGEETLQRDLKAALAISDEESRACALAALASQLSGGQGEEALQRGLEAALAISDEESRARALAALAPQLSDEQLPITKIFQEILGEAKAIQSKDMGAFSVSARLEFMEHSEAIKSAIDYLRKMKGSTRGELLDLCGKFGRRLRAPG